MKARAGITGLGAEIIGRSRAPGSFTDGGQDSVSVRTATQRLPARLSVGVEHSSPRAETGVVSAREISLSSVKEAEWNVFAVACDCSVRSTRAYAIAWELRRLRKFRVRFFEIYAEGDGTRKIGQCAVGTARSGASVFLDRLAILPQYSGQWSEAMSATLASAGTGSYEYGWELNVEPPREAEFASLAGVAIERTVPLVVQAIDFNQWESWDAFMRGIRKGARQSAQFARRDIPDLEVESLRGRKSLFAVPALLRLRVDLSKRKSLGLRAVNLVASYLGWMLFCPDQTVARLAAGSGRILAANYAVEFGPHTYYVEAASVPGNQGAAWALLISTIEHAYERDPRGRFVMGYVDYATHDEEMGGGLLRSRTAVRAIDYPTSIVNFRYAI